LKLFAEKGYDATTLANIATIIGIKKPSIYAHYPSKMNLFLVIVQGVIDDYRTCWFAALEKSATLPADERLDCIFFSVSNYFINNRDKLAFLVRLWLFPPADCSTDALLALDELTEELIIKIAAIFQQGMDDHIFFHESPEEMAHAYFCVLDGYLARVIRHPDFDYKKALSTIWKPFMLRPQQNHHT